jgi:hypothetical protein
MSAHQVSSGWFVLVLVAIILVGCCTSRDAQPPEERNSTCDSEKIRIEQLETELALANASPTKDDTACAPAEVKP